MIIKPIALGITEKPSLILSELMESLLAIDNENDASPRVREAETDTNTIDNRIATETPKESAIELINSWLVRKDCTSTTIKNGRITFP